MSDTLTYLMGNRWIKDVEGEFISVEDAYAVPLMNLNVDGKSTQVTTTGKNLIPTTMPSNAIHATISGSGTNVSATLASAGNAWVFTIPCERNTQYIYQASKKGSIGGIGLSTTESLQVGDTVRKIALMTNYSSYAFSSGEYDYIIIQIGNTTEFNNIPANKAMISVGSSITNYEPYTANKPSPRPDWPQEITSIDGTLLKICAKNFVLSDDPENPNANYTFNSSKRVMWDSEMEGFRLTTSGSGVAYAAHASRTPRATFVAPRDGVYTFGVDTKYYTSGTDFGFRVDVNGTVKNGYGWGSSSAETEWTRHSITRTLSKGDHFGATIYVTCLWRNISVVEGSEDIYEPYVGNVAQLLPDGYSLRSLPNGTKDELHLTYFRPSDRPGWAWYDRKLVKRLDAKAWSTGFGQYQLNSSEHPRVRLSVGSNAQNGAANSLCNRFVYNSSTYNYGTYGSYYISGNYAYFILDDSIEDIDAANTWLAEHPINLQYKLVTPTSINLDPIELPIMQSGVTNIWSDPSTNLSITYERDKNIVITNLKAAVDDLATS